MISIAATMIVINERLERLWQQAGARQLICIQAPGGYGKTTAAAWWAAQLARPVVWLYLERDPGCRHPQTWLTTLAEQMAAVAGTAAPLGDVRVTGIARMVQALFPEGLTIVVDDFHLVANPELAPVVSELCERLAPLTRVIITSRQTIDVAVLHRWLARRQAVVLTEADLQLAPRDVAQWLGIVPAEAEQLHQRTNGWLFALNLLQDFQLRGEGWPESDFRDQLGAYLFRDLLLGYPAETVRFMQLTALMESFTLDDCQALGLSEAEDALQRVRQGRLCLVRADGSFTYHALIREALVEGLPAEERRHWQRTIGHHCFARRHQACLSLFVAAGDWQALAQAILYFHCLRWVEHQPDRPTARYWAEQMPAETLQDDPWYLLVYWITYWRKLDAAGRLSLIERIETRVAHFGDDLARGYALVARSALSELMGDRAALTRLLPEIEALRHRWPADHPVSMMLRDQVIKYYLYLQPDRAKWEGLMAELAGIPLLSPGIRQSFFFQNLNAAEKYLLWGEHVSALRHLQQAAMVVSGGPSARSVAPYIQALLSGRMRFEPPIDEALAAAIFEDEADDAPIFPVMAAFAGAEAAFHAGEGERACRLFETVVSYFEQTRDEVWLDMEVLAGLRVGAYYQAIGDFERAHQAYGRAQRSDRSVYETGNVHFHLAWLAWATGDAEGARTHLAEAERRSRHDDSKFLLSQILLLQSLVAGTAVTDEARQLVDRWDLRYGLSRTFAPGLALLDGVSPATVAGPRVRIYTLGGLRVFVDGREIAWRRFNSQLVLLDLLLYRDGSPSSLMEQRYWAPNGNVGIRTDIQMLRQTLEPGTPGRESRYLRLFGGKYRWMAEQSLYWWDAEAFETLAQTAMTASQPEVAAAARKQALELYKGHFVPDLEAFRAFEPVRQRLHQLHQRLIR